MQFSNCTNFGKNITVLDILMIMMTWSMLRGRTIAGWAVLAAGSGQVDFDLHTVPESLLVSSSTIPLGSRQCVRFNKFGEAFLYRIELRQTNSHSVVSHSRVASLSMMLPC